jgi:hypothetical protein
MSSHPHKHPKNETLLSSMAESIGTTLGAIAAKASAVPEVLSHSGFLHTAKQEGKKFVRKSKTVARKIKQSASRNRSTRGLARATRRGLRRATTGAKRVLRPVPLKKRVARKVRRKK